MLCHRQDVGSLQCVGSRQRCCGAAGAVANDDQTGCVGKLYNDYCDKKGI